MEIFRAAFFNINARKGLFGCFMIVLGVWCVGGLLTRRLISCTPRGGVVSAQRQVEMSVFRLSVRIALELDIIVF